MPECQLASSVWKTPPHPAALFPAPLPLGGRLGTIVPTLLTHPSSSLVPSLPPTGRETGNDRPNLTHTPIQQPRSQLPSHWEGGWERLSQPYSHTHPAASFPAPLPLGGRLGTIVPTLLTHPSSSLVPSSPPTGRETGNDRPNLTHTPIQQPRSQLPSHWEGGWERLSQPYSHTHPAASFPAPLPLGGRLGTIVPTLLTHPSSSLVPSSPPTGREAGNDRPNLTHTPIQ